MNGPLFELLERLHGHLGWLGLAALVHPLISLRRRGRLTRGGRWSLGLAVVLLALSYGGGLWLYPEYRAHVKPGLAQEAPGWMLAFESKEHLALCCVVLALGGAALAWRAEGERSKSFAWSLLFLSWIAGALVGSLGVAVAAHSAWL